MSGSVTTVGSPLRGDVKFLGKQYRPWIRRPPEYGLIVVVPREDAMPIGFKEPLRTEIPANGKQAFGGSLLNGWETDILPIQAIHHRARYVKHSEKAMLAERGGVSRMPNAVTLFAYPGLVPRKPGGLHKPRSFLY